MVRQNEIEEMIRLIYNGVDVELLAFELEIPIEEVQSYKEQLLLRQFAKESVKNGKIQIAIEKLNSFIESSSHNIVERMMLLRLQAYADRKDVNEDDLIEIEEERKKIGFSRNIEDILNELKIQIPKRKTSNLRRKEKTVEEVKEETIQEVEEIVELDYEEIIKRYKEEIAEKPQNTLNKRNLLAFAYFRAGKINEAREELVDLIQQHSNYTAYRQLVHIEKREGNFDDAKLWAYECLDKFPESISMREQLISMARAENDIQEIIKQLKEINRIDPENKNGRKMLDKIKKEEGR